MISDAKDAGDNVVKDSESTNRDLSMGVIQTDDLPQGGITSRPGCQFHPNVRTQNYLTPPHRRSPRPLT